MVVDVEEVGVVVVAMVGGDVEEVVDSFNTGLLFARPSVATSIL